MSDFPKMLYRAPGEHLLHGVLVDWRIVDGPAELERATDEGWHRTPTEANDAHGAQEDQVEQVDSPLDLTSPPTRAELEAQATTLGLKFDGRFSDKRLGVMIADALRAAT